MTPMLEQAILAAKELPETDQDALAELAREGVAEHDASQNLDAAYAEVR